MMWTKSWKTKFSKKASSSVSKTVIKPLMIYKINIARKGLNYLLSTWSRALLLAFPQVNSISPFMSMEVCFKISLCTVPIFSIRMQELDCKHSLFRLQTGALTTGAETSHSKQAWWGAVTSTSSSSLTTNRIWAESRSNRQGKLLAIMHDKVRICQMCSLFL